MRGDRVEVVVDVGDGTRTYEVEATRAGRRVDVRSGRGLVEVTRGGTPVRTATSRSPVTPTSTPRRSSDG